MYVLPSLQMALAYGKVLLGLRHQLLVEHLIGRGNEIDPLQPMDGLLLGVGRRATGRQDAGHAAQRSAAGKLEYATTLRI
jgi:hypothetical protein